MKKITPAILALFLCAWGHLAFAQMASFFPGPGTVHTTGGGTPFSITSVSNANDSSATTPVTFTAQAIGTADATRIVVVGIPNVISAVSVTGVTIGGIAATQAVGAAGASGSGAQCDIWYASVPTGTTANIVVTLSAGTARVAIIVHSVIGTGSSFAAATKSTISGTTTTLSNTITVPAGGGAISYLSSHGGALASLTPTNMTTDFAVANIGTLFYTSGSDATHSGSTPYTFTWTSAISDQVMSTIAFNP